VTDIFGPCQAAAGVVEEPPEVYNRLKPLSLMASAIGRPLVCQARRVPRECKSHLAKEYNAQKPNPQYKAPLNAPKSSEILRCRSQELDTSEHLGYPPALFDGTPYYCIFLSEHVLAMIKELEWLDDMTSYVFLANLIYTPNSNTITMTRINFDVADSGRIRSTYAVDTNRVLNESPIYGMWRVLMVALFVCVLIRIAHGLRMYYCAEGRRSLGKSLDLGLSCAYALVCGISFVRRQSARDEITDVVLGLVACFTPAGQQTISVTVATYFRTLDFMASVAQREEVMKLLAYAVVLISICRIIAYMSVHPRISLIANTISQAADDMFHFMIVFIFVFLTFAWLAFWSFGPDKDEFQTYMAAVNSCFQMLTGSFPWGDEASEGLMQKVWWGLYLFLVYFISVQLVFAIIIEAFLRVRKEVKKSTATCNVFFDLAFLVIMKYKRVTHGWPSHDDLLQHVDVTNVVHSDLTAQELASSRFVHFAGARAAEDFLLFYHKYLGSVVLGEKAKEAVSSKHKMAEAAAYTVKLFKLKDHEVEQVVGHIVTCQRVWRTCLALRQASAAKRVIERRRQRLYYQGVPPNLTDYFVNLLGMQPRVAHAYLKNTPCEALSDLLCAIKADTSAAVQDGISCSA